MLKRIEYINWIGIAYTEKGEIDQRQIRLRYPKKEDMPSSFKNQVYFNRTCKIGDIIDIKENRGKTLYEIHIIGDIRGYPERAEEVDLDIKAEYLLPILSEILQHRVHDKRSTGRILKTLPKCITKQANAIKVQYNSEKFIPIKLEGVKYNYLIAPVYNGI